MTSIIESIRAEYLRYKGLAEAAIDQLSESELSAADPNGGNSIAVICWHISGNFRSRFTEFLSSDGEKPWRDREEEFQARTVTRPELLSKWDQGWEVLLGTLANLADEQLQLTVTIRRQPLRVHEALHRSLAHLSYHVGQIVYVAKSLRGKDWKSLSIPPGKSDAYNKAPTLERPTSHQAMLSKSDLPAGVGKPALRAFAAAGYTRLEDFTRLSEADLIRLHGVGPKAIRLIRSALAARGQSFA